MIPYAQLPHLNAVLNSASALFLLAGYLFIRRRRIALHRLCMLCAFAASSLFLASYLIYHFHAGSVRFQGQGIARTLYFFILTTHTILAAVIVPLILRTLYLALRERWPDHRRLARWTWPLWLYVSATGVAIYLMLYRLY